MDMSLRMKGRRPGGVQGGLDCRRRNAGPAFSALSKVVFTVTICGWMDVLVVFSDVSFDGETIILPRKDHTIHASRILHFVPCLMTGTVELGAQVCFQHFVW